MKNRSNGLIIQIGLWTASITLIIVIGLIYFPKEVEGLGFFGALYYSIRLFIMEHDLPCFPKSGPLIFIYFFAPIVALSAIGTAIKYFLRFSPELKTRWKSDHVVICGMGRIGRLLATTLRQKGVSVVGVDSRNPEHFEEWRSEYNGPIIFGDYMSLKILEKAGVPGARAVIFASGDDLANLEAVVGAYEWLRKTPGPIRLLWAHIANEQLADTARSALLTKGSVGIRLFDTYHIAATRMVAKYFNHDMRQGISEIIILGFGKFGRDLMEVIIRDAGRDENWRIRVIDIENRENEVYTLAQELNIREHVSFMQADIKTLKMVDKEYRVFFLCTDDDIGNLATALMLGNKIKADTNNVYVRMARWPMPAIEDHLRENRGITFVNINGLMVNGIEELPGIFEPAKESDLKRYDPGLA